MNKKIIFRILCGGLITLTFGYVLYKVFTEDSEKFGGNPPCYENPTQIRPLPSVTKQEIDDTVAALNKNTVLNTQINSIFSKIDLLEIGYYTKNKTYWNGWKTHAEPVEYGTTAIPNNWDCAKENMDSWSKESAGVISTNLPAQFQVVVLTRQNGSQSYVINAAVQKNGVQYNKGKLADGTITEWRAYRYD